MQSVSDLFCKSYFLVYSWIIIVRYSRIGLDHLFEIIKVLLKTKIP